MNEPPQPFNINMLNNNGNNNDFTYNWHHFYTLLASLNFSTSLKLLFKELTSTKVQTQWFPNILLEDQKSFYNRSTIVKNLRSEIKAANGKIPSKMAKKSCSHEEVLQMYRHRCILQKLRNTFSVLMFAVMRLVYL